MSENLNIILIILSSLLLISWSIFDGLKLSPKIKRKKISDKKEEINGRKNYGSENTLVTSIEIIGNFWRKYFKKVSSKEIFYHYRHFKKKLFMKRNLAVFFVLAFAIFYSQEFKIISLKDSIPENKNYEVFEFINNKSNLENSQYLATISCEGEKSNFSNIFEIAKFQSQNLGANSFKYIKKEETPNKIKIYFDIYYSTNEFLIENRKNEEENKIYVFGSDNLNDKKNSYYKLNGKLRTIENRKFDKIDYHLGSKVKIGQKDFMASPIIFEINRNFKSIFFNTDGWGRNESREGVKDYGIVTVTTYELFYKFDKNLGYTLLEIY